MEHEDDLRFAPGFQLEREHADLNRDGREKQKIVARERSTTRIPKRGRDDERNHQPAEEAGPCLLDAEADELIRPRAQTPAVRGPAADRGFCVDESRKRRPEASGASFRCVGFGLVQATI